MSKRNARDIVSWVQAMHAPPFMKKRVFWGLLVVGGRVVAGMERRARGDCFKANFSQGGEVVRWVPDKQAEWLALESARILRLDIAGIDFVD